MGKIKKGGMLILFWVLPFILLEASVTNKFSVPSFSGDFNQDGKPDLFVQTKTAVGFELSVVFLDGNSILEEKTIASLANKKAKVVGIGFYNADEFPDILIQDGNKVSYLALKAGLIPGERVEIGKLQKGFKIRASGDWNQDGISDLVLQKLVKLKIVNGANLEDLTEPCLVQNEFKVVGFSNTDGVSELLFQRKRKLSKSALDRSQDTGFSLVKNIAKGLKPLSLKGIDVVLFGEKGKKYKLTLNQGKTTLVTSNLKKASLKSLRKLDYNLGKIVSVSNLNSPLSQFFFQKGSQAFSLNYQGEVFALAIVGLGAKKKIVGPR